MPVRLAPGHLPLLGHLPAYLGRGLGFFAGCRDESGAVVRCRLRGDGYLLNAPEDIRHVLVGNHRNYVKSRRLTGSRAEYPRPHSLLTSAGPEHRRRRGAMQPLFGRRLVERLVERARANAERVTASWADGDEVDVGEAMTAMAQRNILEALFGSATEADLERLAAASRARRRAFERLFFSLLPLHEYLPTRANRSSLLATRRLRAAVGAAIAERREASERPADLLSMLMGAAYDDGSSMGDRSVRDEVLTISLTGYDSVSEALAWTFHLLARHPEAGESVAAEALAGQSSAQGAFTIRVVRESLRLFPPTWLFVRIARAADPLPSGARIPAGAKVYVCPYVVHRNRAYWPEPERFAPERFAGEGANDRPRYAYLPFGGGPHVCIGEALAMAQIVTILTTVAAGIRLAPARAGEVVPAAGLTLRPERALRMRVERRAP